MLRKDDWAFLAFFSQMDSTRWVCKLKTFFFKSFKNLKVRSPVLPEPAGACTIYECLILSASSRAGWSLS